MSTSASRSAHPDPIDFEALFESAPDAYLVLAPDLRIVAANRQRSIVTMIAEEDIVGRPLFEVFPDNPDDLDASGVSNLRASLQRVIDTGVADRMPRQKYDIRRPIDLGGEFETRYWSPLNSPVLWPDGTLRYIVHRVEDVTSTVLVEEQEFAQRQLASTLAEAVRERTSELVEANTQLLRANEAKNEFLSRISHELRTPLNAILGFGQLLQMDNLGADHRASVDQIIKAGGHLLELIDEVLDISRVESGSLRLSLEPVSVHEIVADTMAMIEPIAAARGIALQNDLPPGLDLHVHADRQRFRQVLVNLVANAVKYNRENGMVRIGQNLIADGVVRISVADTGVGIPIHGMPRLFQPFERLEADSTPVQGTGLGLALTKSLVEAMHGEIGVTSTYGIGTTFWVDFALTQPSEIDEAVLDTALEAISRAGSPARSKTVLYVEDNLSNVRLVERVMERRPEVNLIVAMQGRLAFDLAVEHKPSLVLLDLHLPDIGGEDVLRLLRADARTAAIPVIILSADATPTQIRGLHALGATDYLTKPFDIPRLLSLVDGNGNDGVSDDDVNHPLDRAAVITLGNLLAGQARGQETFGQLIELFAADCVDHLRELREAVLTGDAGRVEHFAHRLSGSSGNLGARVVARLCRELEQIAISRDLAVAPGVLHRLEEACSSAIAALRAEVDVTSRR